MDDLEGKTTIFGNIHIKLDSLEFQVVEIEQWGYGGEWKITELLPWK